MKRFLLYGFLVLIYMSCAVELDQSGNDEETLFIDLSSNDTRVEFHNDLQFTEDYNPYTFKNFFNGGGVALGDINNDNLLDIYFAGNLVDNKLFLNKGDFQFEDVTKKYGLECPNVWSSGVSMIDVNGDGYLDIYVCKSGRPDVDGVRHNELFINNGDGSFDEKSNEYGLDFNGLAVHAVFFDYDLDGDLDCYLLNNSIRSVGGYDMIEGQRDIPNSEGGNKLLKCMLSETQGKQKKYIDITKEAGIYESSIGFGLGVSVSDLNGDLWPDFFVSNDFFEKDYLYINNQDGTFSEVVDQSMAELSMGSMGADIADLDNDGRPDIFVTEMLPATLERYKSKVVFENYEKSQLATSKGYHRQFARNTLHYNTGNDFTSNYPLFSDISRYAGVDATEWSWGALMEDFDQDGLKDVFVANGIYKDLLDQDYLNFFNPNEIRKQIKSGEKNAVVNMFNAMPSSSYPNFYFKNNGDYTFQNESKSSGLGIKAEYSNGSAYGDLDNDGDLDLVTNNIGSNASIYKNTSNKPSLTLSLKGKGYNTQNIGAKVVAYTTKGQLIKEVYPMRGFESSVDPRVQFSFADMTVDSIVVYWPDRTRSKYIGPIPDSISLNYIWDKSESESFAGISKTEKKVLLKRSNIVSKSIAHTENQFSDFDRVRTLPGIISNEGPELIVQDLNGDGKQDAIMTNSKGSSPFLLKNNNDKLVQWSGLKNVNPKPETVDLLIHDLNGDGHKDIYFANGGSEHGRASSDIKDEVYLCDAKECIKAAGGFINTAFSSSSSVALIDLDNDKDLDIIVGERLQPNAYGVPADIVRYINDNGKYIRKDATGDYKDVGLIRDIEVADINEDGLDDIIVACEYSALKLLVNNGHGEHEDTGLINGLNEANGIWSKIRVVDIDDDGDLDIVATNIGENNRMKRMADSLAVLYVNDFDQNGSVETILCSRESTGDYPLTLRDDLVMQLPLLKKKALKYSDYAKANIDQLISPSILDNSIIYKLNEYRSGIFFNEGSKFLFSPLPIQAQWTDQRAVWIGDLNSDGLKDIILGGNQYLAKPELGINGASYGQVFLQNEGNNFRYLGPEASGLIVKGQIRDIESIQVDGEDYILIARNNNTVVDFKIQK